MSSTASSSGSSTPVDNVAENQASAEAGDVPESSGQAAKRAKQRGAQQAPQGGKQGNGVGKKGSRSRSGCFTCRVRRKKCDEKRPVCGSCSKLALKCHYKAPQWWATTDQRKRQMQRISTRIRQSRIIEKEGDMQEYVKRVGALAQKAPVSSRDDEATDPMLGEGFDPYSYTPTTVPPLSPYNINVTTETQAFMLPAQANSSAPNPSSAATMDLAPGPASHLPVDPSLISFDGSSGTSIGQPASTHHSSYASMNPDPLNPLTPMTPVTPMNSMHSVNSTNTMYPISPMAPMYSMNSVNTSYAMNPMTPVTPMSYMDPMGYMNQMNQMGFVNQVGSYVNPVNAITPISPMTPMNYMDPNNSMMSQYSTNQVSPMDPTHSANPMSSISPTSATHLANPMDRMNPTYPVDPMSTANPTQYMIPDNQTGFNFSTGQADPMPMYSVYPMDPMGSANTTDSMTSSNQAGMMNSTHQAEPTSAMYPADPTNWGNPVDPAPATVTSTQQSASSADSRKSTNTMDPPPVPASAQAQTDTPRNTSKGKSRKKSNPIQFNHAMDEGLAQPNRSLSNYLLTVIPLQDEDKPLLEHFVDNVVRVVLPIPEIYPGNQTHVTEIVNSLQNNRAYLHCCLSASAIHLKACRRLEDQVDPEIMDHRFTAISQLSRALLRGNGDMHVLNGTLALIFFYSAVSSPEDYLPDISWTHHFTAVWNLVKKLDRPPSPFNVSLIAWIDILGSTMVGRTPAFSHTYRTKNMRGISSGLERLMGCDDRIMYLISEIACLEDLIADPSAGMVEAEMRKQFADLIAQLSWTEPPNKNFENVFAGSGKIKPDKLTKLISGIFRTAARIYLYSVMPGFNYHDGTIMNLVGSIADTLSYIPSGPHGFDRCLAWPLFMAGVHSVSSSHFRRVLTERVAALGYKGRFGSFGQMYRILKEVWKATDGPLTTPENVNQAQQAGPSSSQLARYDEAIELEVSLGHTPLWRAIMKHKKWEFLIM
ncbi:transcriptional regulator family: Fungal Specific TF [Aspergillus niger]|nr:transcriptional regulator family: Fungal Specific TF [Aspergillus niger]